MVSILFALRLFIVLTDPFSMRFQIKTAFLATAFQISSILGIVHAFQASFALDDQEGKMVHMDLMKF